MQDELVNMMSRHLQLQPVQHQDSSMPPTPQVSPQPVPIAYITQHYHHSSHQAVQTDSPASSDLEHAGINASALLPTQLALFTNAGVEQKQRLIELWQIAPPTYGNQMMPADMGNWPQTSMEKEEEAARHRWEEKEREKLKNLSAPTGYDSRNSAEPYIVSGYNARARTSEEEYKRCKDPVYNSREWWQLSDEEPMEHQYGMLQQMMYGNGLEYGRKQDEDQEMS